MKGRPLQDQLKIWEPAEDVHSENRNSSTDEDANHKTSSVLCKLLQQQAAPEKQLEKQFYFLPAKRQIKSIKRRK